MIGLVALSIASCTSEKKHREMIKDKETPNYYVNNGNGSYNHGGISPFMVWWMLSMNRGGSPTYVTNHVYQSRSGQHYSSTNGVRSSVSKTSYKSYTSNHSSRSGVTRGGFGRSSSSHSSSAAS